MKIIYWAGFLFVFYNFIYTNEEQVEAPEYMVKQARKIQAFCQKKTNASIELVAQSRKRIFANDRNLQCFLHCVLDTLGLVDKNNEIILEPLKVLLPVEWYEMIELVEGKCETEGSDPCEIAYNAMLCFATYNKKYPIIL